MITQHTYERLDRETSQARGLPNEAFTSQEFLELENRHLFAATWVLAGLASEIPKQGDIKPVEVAGRALFIARDRDDQIQVFQNVCPHRGARLVTESLSGVPVLTCPYHAWSFGLDGSLNGRPHFHGPSCHDKGDGGNDKVSLFSVRNATWHDWVFVNLDGKAPPLEDYLAPATSRLAGYDLSSFVLAHKLSFEFACNWKLALENYNDVYHVFKVHPTLDKMHEASDRYPMQPDGPHLFNGYSFAGPGRGLSLDETGPALPDLPSLPESLTTRMIWISLFPNTTLNVYPSNLQINYFEPIGADRTIMHQWYYFVGDAARGEEHRSARELLYDEWAKLNAEDEGVCQRMQQGRQCDAYDGGRLAPYWDVGTVHFQKQIAQAILEGRS